eukprot:6464587-Amphidinium_carterae.1
MVDCTPKTINHHHPWGCGMSDRSCYMLHKLSYLLCTPWGFAIRPWTGTKSKVNWTRVRQGVGATLHLLATVLQDSQNRLRATPTVPSLALGRTRGHNLGCPFVHPSHSVICFVNDYEEQPP